MADPFGNYSAQSLSQQAIGFVPAAMVGAGLAGNMRGNVQHPFDRVFFYNTSNLAGQILTFFQTPIAGTYTVLNGAPTQYTKTNEDTNWDQANQAQYSYVLTGMYFKVQTLTQQSFLASPSDMSTWADYLRALVEDSSIKIISEDNILMRQKTVHIPEGNSVQGFSNPTGTPAANAVVAQPVVSSGAGFASNFFSFGNMALWVPKTSRFNVTLTFGASLLANNAVYKPVNSSPPVIFAECRFQGLKIQATS